MAILFDGMRVELTASILHHSQRCAGVTYTRISARHYLVAAECREEWVVAHDAKYHPRGVAYPAPAAVRAAAHAAEHPGCVVSGFGALALYGLGYFVDGADTTLLHPRAVNSHGDSITPSLRRRSRAPLEVWQLEHRGCAFNAAAPPAALVQALQDLKNGVHRWKVVDVPGFTPEQVMAVQLVDCARRFLGLTPEQILDAARGKLNRRWLESILGNSSRHADSPKETEMRLLLRQLAREFGCSVCEQVDLVENGRLITIFDLTIPELRVAVMYDGEHHWGYEQRQKDASINIKAAKHGWTLVRCSSATMLECLALVRDLLSKKVHGAPAVE